jgi:hypothetical protein
MVSECHIWEGSFDADGYAQWPSARWFGTRRAARILFYLETGEWPQVVMHTCDNPACVNIDHLRAGTWKSNHADMTAKGRASKPPSNPHLVGDGHPSRKLCAADVRGIRRAIKNGVAQTKLAFIYGVSKTTITAIKQRRLWRHS